MTLKELIDRLELARWNLMASGLSSEQAGQVEVTGLNDDRTEFRYVSVDEVLEPLERWGDEDGGNWPHNRVVTIELG